jgi:7-dehydrocholesterol reductase
MAVNNWATLEGERSKTLLPFIRDIIGPLAIMIATPLFAFILVEATAKHKGSLLECFQYLFENPSALSPFQEKSIWPTAFDQEAWSMLVPYMVFELILQKYCPGKEFKATMTSTGHIPIYKANGVQSLFISIVTFLACWSLGLIKARRIYDKFGEILAALNLFAVVLCGFLTIKGRNFPSTKDCGTNGNIVLDYYWGTELYPRVFGWDVKQFTNCRFGMMYWAIGPIAYALSQYETKGYINDSMMVSVVLQLIYVTKFFWWETGYFCSMDIQHDRGGFYLCWGCLCWVPSVYTSQTFYLTDHPVHLGTPLALTILISGILCIWANYDCDRQRQAFRKNPKEKIWGKAPKVIYATYLTQDGTKRDSTTLTLTLTLTPNPNPNP